MHIGLLSNLSKLAVLLILKKVFENLLDLKKVMDVKSDGFSLINRSWKLTHPSGGVAVTLVRSLLNLVALV